MQFKSTLEWSRFIQNEHKKSPAWMEEIRIFFSFLSFEAAGKKEIKNGRSGFKTIEWAAGIRKRRPEEAGSEWEKTYIRINRTLWSRKRVP